MRASSLTLRVLAAVVFLPAFYFITRTGSLPFLFLIGAVSLLGTWEMYRLLRPRGLMPLFPTGLIGAGVLLALLYRGLFEHTIAFFSLYFILLLISLILRRGSSPIGRSGGALLILFYAGLLPGYLVLLREMPRSGLPELSYDQGASFIFLLFLIVWGSDTGAYFTGRAIGRHPLAPSISPKKTIEGSIGGLLSAVLGGLIASVWFLPELGPGPAAVLGLLAGALGQAGDLIESIFKREVDVKDSAGWIPGHGGVLDRFDGILLAAPLVYYYLRFYFSG